MAPDTPRYRPKFTIVRLLAVGLVCLLGHGLYIYVRYYRWRYFEDDCQDRRGINYVDGMSPREAKAFEAEWRRRHLESAP